MVKAKAKATKKATKTNSNPWSGEVIAANIQQNAKEISENIQKNAKEISANIRKNSERIAKRISDYSNSYMS